MHVPRNGGPEAVAIDEVKKFIARQDLEAESQGTYSANPFLLRPGRLFLKRRSRSSEAARPDFVHAFYLAEKGYRPVVFEKNEKPGGMLVYGIPSFKLEKDVVDAEIEIIRQMGVEIRCGIEMGKDITLDELRAQGYQAFCLCHEGALGRKTGGHPWRDSERRIDGGKTSFAGTGQMGPIR
ncbi:MAG: hypothetical protein ACLTLQ_06315 [[Clostridium] scindens]